MGNKKTLNNNFLENSTAKWCSCLANRMIDLLFTGIIYEGEFILNCSKNWEVIFREKFQIFYFFTKNFTFFLLKHHEGLFSSSRSSLLLLKRTFRSSKHEIYFGAYFSIAGPGSQSTYSIYLEYHSECPLVGIGTPPPPLTQATEPSPRNQNGGGGHTRLRVRRWGSPNSDDWRKILALCLLCGRIHGLS